MNPLSNMSLQASRRVSICCCSKEFRITSVRHDRASWSNKIFRANYYTILEAPSTWQIKRTVLQELTSLRKVLLRVHPFFPKRFNFQTQAIPVTHTEAAKGTTATMIIVIVKDCPRMRNVSIYSSVGGMGYKKDAVTGSPAEYFVSVDDVFVPVFFSVALQSLTIFLSHFSFSPYCFFFPGGLYCRCCSFLALDYRYFFALTFRFLGH